MRVRHLLAAAAVVGHLVVQTGGPMASAGEEPTAPAPATSKAVDEEIALRALKSALPAGWSVTRMAKARVPDGWVTKDGGGFLVEGGDGKPRFRTWFLPRDWIGICPRDQREVWNRYCAGVHIADGWKAITLSDDPAFINGLWGKLGDTASLVNSGGQLGHKIFGDRLAAVDLEAQALMDDACLLDGDRNGAALSLVLVGVPALGVFRDTALHGRGLARSTSISVLDWVFEGWDSAEPLCRILEDPNADNNAVKSATFAIGKFADPASGPALLKAFRRTTWTEGAVGLAVVLERIRYKEAAPYLLERLREEPEDSYGREKYAKALATLRYKPALEDVRALAGPEDLTADWILGLQERQYLGDVARVSLLRMTAPWGEPVAGLRVLLLPPKSAEVGKKVIAALVLENVGDKDLEFTEGLFEAKLSVNGAKGIACGPTAWDRNCMLPVNDVYAYPVEIPPEAVAARGTVRICVELGKARSNEISFEVTTAAESGK